jgi:hypothetical protein
MAIKFLQTPDGSDDSIRFHPIERLKGYLFGTIVLFARQVRKEGQESEEGGTNILH